MRSHTGVPLLGHGGPAAADPGVEPRRPGVAATAGGGVQPVRARRASHCASRSTSRPSSRPASCWISSSCTSRSSRPGPSSRFACTPSRWTPRRMKGSRASMPPRWRPTGSGRRGTSAQCATAARLIEHWASSGASSATSRTSSWRRLRALPAPRGGRSRVHRRTAEYVVVTSLWAFRRNELTVEFARKWMEESVGKDFHDASGLPVMLLNRRTRISRSGCCRGRSRRRFPTITSARTACTSAPALLPEQRPARPGLSARPRWDGRKWCISGPCGDREPR